MVGTPQKRIGTVATDGSVKGAPGKYALVGYGIVQLCPDHEGEPKYGGVWRSTNNMGMPVNHPQVRSFCVERDHGKTCLAAHKSH